MTDRSRTTGDDRSQDTSTDNFRRREFVALGAGATATMLAGCAGDGGLTSDGSDGSDGPDGSDGSQTLTGNFRLLISDAPADIGDFDQLNVTLDEARLFEANEEGDGEEDDDDEEATDEEEEDDTEGDDEDAGSDQTGNETDDESDPANGTADEEDGEETDEDDGDSDDGEADDEEGEDDEDDDDDSDRGFTVVALDGATVDLTQVIEDDAIAVFDGEIPTGSYERIELSVTDVEGIVDGEEVEVKLPSEKLQITNGFEVTPDEPVSFVFDINVVKRGPNGYILRPVISGSGVAGRDVEVNEIDEDDDEDDEDGEDGEDGADGDNEEDDGGDSEDGGDETDDGSSDAENGTATNETES